MCCKIELIYLREMVKNVSALNGFMSFANDCILFLFMIYTASQHFCLELGLHMLCWVQYQPNSIRRIQNTIYRVDSDQIMLEVNDTCIIFMGSFPVTDVSYEHVNTYIPI